MEKGLVVKADNKKMTIRFGSTEACKKCGACQIKDDQAILAGVDNTVDAKVGDTVAIENKPSTMVMAAVIIYLLPVIFLIGGYFLSLFIVNSLNFNDKYAVLGALFTFALSFYVVTLIDKRLNKSSTFKPIAIKKL